MTLSTKPFPTKPFRPTDSASAAMADPAACLSPMPWSLTRQNTHSGFILIPPTDNPLWISHAQAPTMLPLDPRQDTAEGAQKEEEERAVWRIFLAGRDRHNTSRIFAADVHPDDMSLATLHPDPVLDVGAPGAFDEHGIGPGTAIAVGGRIFLYYMGLSRKSDVPYRPNVGVAISEDGGRSFEKFGGPLLGPSPHLPLGAGLPTVFATDATPGRPFGMWFSRFTEWAMIEGKPEPVYDLLYASSVDGLDWQVHPDANVPLASRDEGGLVRAAVHRTAEGWLMLFTARGRAHFREDAEQRYRLIAATSADGLNFTRTGAIGLDPVPAAGDWDGEMQAYPQIVPDGERTLVLYNGNGFGRDGFGYALLTGTAPAAAQDTAPGQGTAT